MLMRMRTCHLTVIILWLNSHESLDCTATNMGSYEVTGSIHIHGGHLNGDIIDYKSYTIYCDIQFTFYKVVGDRHNNNGIANANIHSKNKGCINISGPLYLHALHLTFHGVHAAAPGKP